MPRNSKTKQSLITNQQLILILYDFLKYSFFSQNHIWSVSDKKIAHAIWYSTIHLTFSRVQRIKPQHADVTTEVNALENC